jgi:hypothetical protein
MTARITKCLDCGYRSYNINRTNCSKCNGKLEILASTNKKELEIENNAN